LATPWSKGRRSAFITSVLRAGSRRYPPKYETMNEACVGIRHNAKTKRDGKHFLCQRCQGEFPSKDVVVDHIEPVIHPEVGFVSWDVFIERLYCDKENMQVLCVPCHKEKTKEENKGRKNASKKANQNK